MNELTIKAIEGRDSLFNCVLRRDDKPENGPCEFPCPVCSGGE